jgi:hypothetical protein
MKLAALVVKKHDFNLAAAKLSVRLLCHVQILIIPVERMYSRA